MVLNKEEREKRFQRVIIEVQPITKVCSPKDAYLATKNLDLTGPTLCVLFPLASLFNNSQLLKRVTITQRKEKRGVKE